MHIYTDEARQGVTRYVEATHFCSHVRKGMTHALLNTDSVSSLKNFIDLRQCLIYDSNEKNARLIGVEFMISKEKYLTLDEDEQKLW